MRDIFVNAIIPFLEIYNIQHNATQHNATQHNATKHNATQKKTTLSTTLPFC
jgi:hypothetical protein